MVTVKEELERALQLASGNSGLPPIIPPGSSSLCGPPNPSDTSGPSMSSDCIGLLRMSSSFSVNSSHSCSKVKSEALEVENPRGHEEDASSETGLYSSLSSPKPSCPNFLFTGGNSSMVETNMRLVQLERVEVDPKDAEPAQLIPGHMEETRPKKVGPPCDFGLKKAGSSRKEKVKCDECGKSVSKRHLLNHKRIVHRGETPHKCLVEDCGMMFALPRGLSDHQRVSHGYPKLRCRVEGCGSEFLFRSKSDAHGRTHRAKTECDECGKMMYTSNLSTHKTFEKGSSQGRKTISMQGEGL